MRPLLAIDDFRDVPGRHPEAGGEVVNSNASRFVGCTNGKHISGVQSPAAVAFAGSRPALGRSIVHVVGMGAKKQMGIVGAQWIVSAGTVVANLDAIRYRTVSQRPDQAMDVHLLAVDTDYAVAVSCGTGPQVTSVSASAHIKRVAKTIFHAVIPGGRAATARAKTRTAPGAVDRCFESRAAMCTGESYGRSATLGARHAMTSYGDVPRPASTRRGVSRSQNYPIHSGVLTVLRTGVLPVGRAA